MTAVMRAARMHEVGRTMLLDEIPRPVADATDVVVEVKACGMVPNLGNVLANWPTWFPHMPLPNLPAIFGLDPAGIVRDVGKKVIGIRPGDRVYVSPVRSCGCCQPCLKGERTQCRYMTFTGYFGFQKESQVLHDLYPHGGFCEFMAAPQYSIIKLPDNVSFREATRIGYWGTAYSALKKAGSLAGRSLLINGISGTLGLGATLIALGRGAARIYGTGRNMALLKRVKALAPERIEILSTEDGPVADRVKAHTDGLGCDVMLDTLGAVASLEAFDDAMHAVRRGGTVINIGGTAGKLPIDLKWLMDEQMTLIGSVWFTAAEGFELANMMASRIVDMSILEHQAHSLDDINAAISSVGAGNGGFSNYLVEP